MKRQAMPLFCRKCANLRHGIFSGAEFCKEECKYNPTFRISAPRSFFRRTAGAA